MTKHCYKCGSEEPEYEVNGYKRDCLECGGMGSVLEVTEMIDLVNDLFLRGLLPEQLVEDVVDEDFEKLELNFDDDTIRAELDAFNDSIEWEDDYDR